MRIVTFISFCPVYTHLSNLIINNDQVEINQWNESQLFHW